MSSNFSRTGKKKMTEKTSELFGRVLFALTMVGIIFLVSRNIYGQEKEKPVRVPTITIDVMPKVSFANPYKQVSFRVRLRITEHAGNRIWSYFATCGAEIKSSQRPVDRVTYEWIDELTVLEQCFFQGCVHRIVVDETKKPPKQEVKNFCSHQEVTVPTQPP